MVSLSAASLALALPQIYAIDNGLGRTPPMGWRSWNCYHREISQVKMTIAADAMVDKSHGVSLLEAGYENCGLDDYYQKCGAGAGGSFHNASGYPIIDPVKFPDMKAMTDHAHSIGLKMGWYGNNCGCSEHQSVGSWGASPAGGSHTDGIHHYEGDIQATIDFGFDGIKLDGCGEFKNLTTFAELMNNTGKSLLIEDCHWGGDGPGDWGDGGHLNTGPNAVPKEKWCPFNFFRTSGDIGASWGSVIRNLLTVDKHQPWDSAGDVRTGPGCWAYPDMLEVGNLPSFEEDRSHFGAWCIVSAPLILGHDLANNETNDKIWPIITNKDAIKVSQTFAEGDAMHPGGLVKSWTPPAPGPGPAPSTTYYLYGQKDKQSGWSVPAPGASGPVKFTPPSYTNAKGEKVLKYGSEAPAVEVCIDFAGGANDKEIKLTTCEDGKASQQLKMENNGNLHLATTTDACLAVQDFEGPSVVQWHCNTGENEEFVFDSSSTSVCSKGAKGHEARCLTAKTTGNGGNSLLLYAKPQPDDAVAALLINNFDGGAAGSNTTATIDFAAIRYKASGKTTVYDIWNQKEVATLDAGASSYTSDTFGSHDSRFYLFSPTQ